MAGARFGTRADRLAICAPPDHPDPGARYSVLGLAPVVTGIWLRVNWRPYPDPRFWKLTVRLAADPGPADPVIAEGRARGLIGIPVTFGGWPRDMMIARPTGITPVLPEPKPGTIVSGTVSGTGRFTFLPSDISFTTSGGGREWLWLTIRDLKYWPKVDIAVTFELTLYDRRLKADILPGGGWTRVPGYGNIWLMGVSAEDTRCGVPPFSPLSPAGPTAFATPGDSLPAMPCGPL